MHDLLLTGDLDIALQEFLWLYDRTKPSNLRNLRRQLGSHPSHGMYMDGVTAPNFATATKLLEGLPGWLMEVILKAMLERVNVKKQDDAEMRPREKNLIREKCVEALRGM
jgi:hypothetical protein